MNVTKVNAAIRPLILRLLILHIILWVVVLYIGEVAVFRLTIWRCFVPDGNPMGSEASGHSMSHLYMNDGLWRRVDEFESNKKVIAMIADPQLTDRMSYDYMSNPILRSIVQFFSDLYMRKSFKSLMMANAKLRTIEEIEARRHDKLSINRPYRTKSLDAIVTLGDLFDNGREWVNDKDFMDELRRFNRIFKQHTDRRAYQQRRARPRKQHLSSESDDDEREQQLALLATKFPLLRHHLENNMVPMFNISGNHDIGYGSILKKRAYDRFVQYFGPLNYKINIGNITFVFLNTPALENPEYEAAKTEAWDFVNAIKSESVAASDFPRVLITHIPLFRPQNSACKYKRKAPIKQGEGYGYKNLVPEATSQEVMTAVQPIRIFTGDDHEQCEYVHQEHNVVENTVGTFSWLQGTHHPSFGILTISNPHGVRCANADKTAHASSIAAAMYDNQHGPATASFQHSYKACYLPNQYRIYTWYGILAITSIVCVLWLPMFYAFKGGHQYLLRQNRKKDQPLYGGSGGGSGAGGIITTSMMDVGGIGISIGGSSPSVSALPAFDLFAASAEARLDFGSDSSSSSNAVQGRVLKQYFLFWLRCLLGGLVPFAILIVSAFSFFLCTVFYWYM